MTILPVNDPAFAPYGRVIAGYDTAVLLNTLCEKTPKPENGTMYEPSVPALEALPIAKEFSARFYGGMPGSARLLQWTQYGFKLPRISSRQRAEYSGGRYDFSRCNCN